VLRYAVRAGRIAIIMNSLLYLASMDAVILYSILSASNLSSGVRVAVAGILIAAQLSFVILIRFRPGRRTRHRLVPEPEVPVVRRPRGREIGWIAVIGLLFFPMLVPAFVSLWAIPVADFPSATPMGIYRAERRSGLIRVLINILLPDCIIGLLALLQFFTGFVTVNVEYLKGELVIGLAVGLMFGSVTWFVTGQASQVKLAGFALTWRPGRVQFLRLLQDAAQKQVLRQAGAAYQFRHAELQEYLAAMHRQSLADRRRKGRHRSLSN
jgi:hypothetical protein